MSNAGSVTVVLSANTTSFSAALTEAQRNLDKLSGKTKDFGGHSVSSMQAASASIRLLENPLGNNIRAIERLISQSKVLSEVMKAAFPLVGAIAIGSMLVKLGTEVADFIKKVNGVPAALKQGFDAMHSSAVLANDELHRTNDALQNEINKLEGKPQNNLAIALDDARIAADRFGISLADDSKKVKELLEENKINNLESLLTGKDSTSNVAGSVKYYLNEIAVLGQQQRDALRKGDTQGAASFGNQLSAKQASYRGYLDNEIKTRTGNVQIADGTTGAYSLVNGDQSSNLNILYGARDVLGDRQDEQTEQALNSSLNSKKVLDENAKAALEQAKAAAQKLKEAQKQAAKDQLDQFEQDNTEWKAAGDVSLADDAKWWAQKLYNLNTNSLNYRAIQKKVDDDSLKERQEYNEGIAKFTKDFLADGDKTGYVSKDTNDYIDQQGKAAAEWIKNLREGATVSEQTADAIAEASLKMAVATGQMTKMDAAQVQATLHTQQYDTALKALADSRKAIEDNESLTDLQRKAQLAGVDAQIASLNGQRSLQVQQDNQTTNPTASLASVGFVNALNDFVVASQNAAEQMRQITDNILSTANAEIVKAMSGQRTDWKNAGAGIFRSVANTGLQKAEGSALSALGFGGMGKPDGTQSKPLYVKMADAANSAASSAGGLLSKLFGGGSSSVTSDAWDSGASSLLSGVGNVFMSALPLLADGGPLSANTMAIVGERGPELFMPSTSGHVIPNHQLSSIGSGGGDTHNWNIDARGATDPAQVKAQVMQGIVEAAPHIIAASQKANQETKRRSSPSAQK